MNTGTTPTLSDMVTQLVAINTNLSLLNATLQDFRWWIMEQAPKADSTKNENQDPIQHATPKAT